MVNNYRSISEVACRLKVAYWRIKYAHAAGYVKEPVRVGNHRLYTEDDIQELEHYFGQRKGGNGELQLQG